MKKDIELENEMMAAIKTEIAPPLCYVLVGLQKQITAIVEEVTRLTDIISVLQKDKQLAEDKAQKK